MEEVLDPLGQTDPNLHRKRIAKDYQMVAETPHGERVLRHLRGLCGQSVSSAAMGFDPLQIAFCEGRRWVWLQIEAALHFSPERLDRMIAERTE